MPDHLHWLMSTTNERSLAQVVAGFKANTSRGLSRSGWRATSPWQAGYYEHRLRNDEDLRQQARYLIASPCVPAWSSN
jgi:REP element-mobilizing transposase RayT